MSSDVELLPCPFCGGTEICIGPMDLPIAGEYWTVGCNNDDCPLCTDSVMVEGGTLEKAAAVWNTRTTDASLAPLQAENERMRAEVSELRAARIAYANEFPATEDGDPDTGNIHENIRALKARAERLRAEVERLRSLCAAAYQMAGVHDAPDEWLDALSNAASGRKFSIDGLLPYMPDAVCEAYARAERLAEALRWAERHCPCGARPESPDTHPHLPGCPVGAALAQEDRNG